MTGEFDGRMNAKPLRQARAYKLKPATNHSLTPPSMSPHKYLPPHPSAQLNPSEE